MGPYLVAAALAASVAASQPPAPSKPAGERKTHQHTQHAAEKRASDPRGTASEPLFIQSIPPADSKDDTEQNEYERHTKPALDWGLTIETGLIALYTLGLTIATVVLAAFTFGLWKDAQRTARLQSIANRRSLNLARKSAGAAERAAEVAEKALLSVERPYLLVTCQEIAIRQQGNPTARYWISNHGKLPGVIDGIYAAIVHSPDQALDDPPLEISDYGTFEQRICGAADKQRAADFSESPLDEEVKNSATLGDWEIFFWIIVRYSGPFTSGHETSNCWRVSFEDKHRLKLIHSGQEQYNYTK